MTGPAVSLEDHYANPYLAGFLIAARKTGQFTDESLDRARAAGDDFAACMDRLVTEAAPSPESIDRLKAAILSMAEPDPGCGETT
jgi:hypothetical protein